MTGTARQRPRKGVDEELNGALDLTQQLDSAELITGTPTVVELVTSDLTITGASINTAIVPINGVSVAIGKAVQFHVTGGVAGTRYTLLVTCSTDASPAQTLTTRVMFRGEA